MQVKSCTYCKASALAFKLNEYKSVHIYLGWYVVGQGGRDVREHGDFPHVQHFLVIGVDQTLTSEEGAGKGWAHAQWVAEPRRQWATSPSKLDPATTPTGDSAVLHLWLVSQLKKVKQLQQSGGVKKGERSLRILSSLIICCTS